MRPEIVEFSDEMPVKALVRGGCQYPYHWHDTLEIMQVLKGSVSIDMGNDNQLLHENDIAIINIGELHRINKSEPDNEILFIHVDGGFCRNMLPDNRYFFIYCCSTYHEADEPEKYRSLKEQLARLARALSDNPQDGCNKNIKNILRAMLDYITYNFDFLRWGYGTRPFDDKRVKRLKKIADHTKSALEVRLELKTLAAEVGVSLQHLSYDIKNKFGVTFQELLYYSKCEQAAKLLLSTDQRIVDIALECGFSDAKYLVKHFKKNFGYTPSKFRKMYRTDNKTLTSQVKYRDYPLPK